MRIQIVGAGCPACRSLEQEVLAWLTQQHVEAPVERVDDLVEIMQLGLWALPGLFIDGKLVLTGYPPHSRLDKVLHLCRGAGAVGAAAHGDSAHDAVIYTGDRSWRSFWKSQWISSRSK